MKYFFSVVMILFINLLEGQSLTYFKDFNQKKVSDQEDAKYYLSTTTNHGIRIEELFRMKDNVLLDFKAFKDDNPYMIWQNFGRTGLEHNFEIPYNIPYPENTYEIDLYDGKLVDYEVKNFIPPSLKGDQPRFVDFLLKNFEYPLFARREGIQGKVVVVFMIDEFGNGFPLSIDEGVHEQLDKEAVKLLLKASNWNPAFINGRPIAVFAKLPIIYRLN